MFNNKKILKVYRKRLRNNATPAETQLWTYLKNKQLLNRKFRRQHSIDNFILDFYCPGEKLAIELDGGYHNIPKQAAADRERDLILNSYGIKVLRFKNELVFKSPGELLETIKSNEKGKTRGWSPVCCVTILIQNILTGKVRVKVL